MSKTRELWKTLVHRWRNRMPVFFKRVFWIGSIISGTAIAVNEALVQNGFTPDGWWSDVCPYLIGGGVGMATIAKLTQQYDNEGRPVKDKEENHNTILDKDDF